MRVLFLVSLFAASIALAADGIPTCYDKNLPIAIDNPHVLNLKKTTANQFLARGHVKGSVGRVFPDRNGHDHFEIKIGSKTGEVLEVVYNKVFGALPKIKIGMLVEACGDYITSTAPTPKYQASPSGAIIHWVHRNRKGHGHEDGYVVIDGTLFGY